MDVDWSIKVLLIILLLLAGAFFSASEVALFSADKKKLKEFKKENKFLSKYLEYLLNSSRRILVTILFANTIVAVAASILSVDLAITIAKLYSYSIDAAVFIQIFVLTFLILLISEVTPKIWANKHPFFALKIVTIPIYWISILFFPISKIVTELLKFLPRTLDETKSRTALQESEIAELANLSVEKGTIEEEEHELIHGIVSFKTVTAREIMTPRVDISAIPIDATFEEIMNIINESGHSRIPVFEGSLDNIKGVIIAKDLLPYLKSQELRRSISIKAIAREPIFVPQTKHINNLLHEFQEKKIHLGIVVDEYGGTAGLITLEDILEEIVGEIRDEHDKEENEITKVNETSYLILGKLSIDELNELLGDNFSSENGDYDTVGGFVFNQIGSIPVKDFSFLFNDYKFIVKDVESNRINKILVEKVKGL